MHSCPCSLSIKIAHSLENVKSFYLQVTVAPLGNQQSEDLLLVEDRGKVVGILAPGDVTLVVSPQWDINLLMVNTVTSVRVKMEKTILVFKTLPVYFLIITTEKVSVASPVEV